MAEAEDIWAGDTLGRKADAEFIINFLLGRIEQRGAQGLPRSYVLNVDAGWGGGKTFFMTRLAKELQQHGHGVSMIDAWEDDHAADPLLSLMSGIEATINPLVKRHQALESTYKVVKKAGLNIAAAAAKGALKQAGRKFLGEASDAIAEHIGEAANELAQKGKDDLAKSLDKAVDKSAEKLLEGFEEGKKSIKQFRVQLGKLIEQIRQEHAADWTLFVLIDELDRCRPTHAIALLERVKHLFNVSGVVFVIATDSAQLSESIRAVYGAGFDGKRYLTRFFDRTYRFPAVSWKQFVNAEIETSGIDMARLSLPPNVDFDALVLGALEAFKATPRDTKRALELTADLAAAWTHKVEIEATVMIPLVVGHQMGAIDFEERGCFEACAKILSDNRFGVAKFRNRSDYHGEEEKVSIGSLISYFSRFKNDIRAAGEQSHENYSMKWVRGRVSDEFARLYRSTYAAGVAVPSVIASYPMQILTAGRLHGVTGD